MSPCADPVCSCCEPESCCPAVCESCGSIRVQPDEAILELPELAEAARRLEAVSFRPELGLEEALAELADALSLVFSEQFEPLSMAAARVLERARWNAHKGRAASGLVPGLEAPVAVLPGGSGPDPFYDPGADRC